MHKASFGFACGRWSGLAQRRRASWCAPLVPLMLASWGVADSTRAAEVEWSTDREYRVLVQVAPVDLQGRARDERPAQLQIDWVAVLRDHGLEGRKCDVGSIQVIACDPATGRPLPYDDCAYAQGPHDRPFRWYDGAIPYDFPEVFPPSSYTDGQRRRSVNPRAGYWYNVVGDWQRGHLTWSHTQQGNAPAAYAIYFNTIPLEQEPTQAPPRGWIGDAMPRFDRWGDTTTGADNTIVDLDDWNGDGLIDIVYGEQYGQVFVMPNRGTASEPQFLYSKMILEADGKPLDVGIHAAVLVADWDSDGANDLLVGTYMNRVAFFRNEGDNTHRQLVYQGLLRDAQGEFLALPVKPVARKSEGVFDEDYYPAMDAVDWDGDGRIDLLAGGYITGRIYFYRNTGRGDDGLPLLELRGPIEADGKPINVQDWCAAPCAADFDADGDLDLISGSYSWKPYTTDRPSFLRYYHNTGTRSDPALVEQPFPIRGKPLSLRLPRARAFDWNSDGRIDLVVGSGADIYLVKNVGTPTQPLFEFPPEPIRIAWGNAPLQLGHQVIDWNGDGLTDLVKGYTVYLNSGTPNPYRWEKKVSVLPKGAYIHHPSGIGDDHFWPYLHDLDRDGRIDVLFGDWYGNVWFHRNLSDGGEARFDLEGHHLLMVNGKPIKVGPINGDIENDFVAHQGARTSLIAGDYDGDGLDDLIVGDTYGIVRYYRNAGPLEDPRFEEPVTVGDVKFRLTVEKTDWDRDGRLDVIASADNHRVFLFRNIGVAGQAARFDESVELDLPPIRGPSVRFADLNRDGDEDLIITGTQGTTLVERSFLGQGYVEAQLLTLQRRASH